MMHENFSSLFASSSLNNDTTTVRTEGLIEYQAGGPNYEYAFQELPDVIIVVDGIDFPCHLKILTEQCPILRDIVSVHGIQQKLSKKQRLIAQNQKAIQKMKNGSTLSLPSTTTVVELRNIEHKIFRALLEFLYTSELPSEFYWDDMVEIFPVLSKTEDPMDCDDPSGESQEQPLYRAMRFLQRLLIAADRYDMVSLKHEIERKLYDEFLYSFTSAEIFVWADSHFCAFLKEKAMDRICSKSGLVDDFIISKDGWTMIRESKRLLEELVLYARYASHEVRCVKYDDESDFKRNQLYYYKVEYLRFRLSELGLDVDGTREMLEERLRPHLDTNHQHFLPTKLTKLSERDVGQNLEQQK